MKTLLFALALLGAMLFVPTLASASGTCTYVSATMASCSGTTDGFYTASEYVPGSYVFTSRGSVWVEGHNTTSRWVDGFYYSYTCNHIGSTWNCTQSVPSYATWTVPG